MFSKKEKFTEINISGAVHNVAHTDTTGKHEHKLTEHGANVTHDTHGGHGHKHGEGPYDHLHGHELADVIKERKGIINARQIEKISLKKFHVPVIGHFANKSVEFKSIIDAWQATGIPYSLIFEACIGKIYKAKNVIWEFKKGNHFIKYKAFYINAASNYKRKVGFNG